MASLPPAPGPNPTAGQAYVQAHAAWRVSLDGADLTDRFAPRLLSLRLSEKRGEEADELSIEVHDHDGQLVLPPEGAVLDVEVGWQRGTEVTAGLVPKGKFRVDEIEWGGPPDVVRISARSADFADSFRTRRSKIWRDTTLGAIVAAIAGNNALAPACHGDLAGRAVTTAEQHNKSDMACQSASNRDPRSAPNRDPLGGSGIR